MNTIIWVGAAYDHLYAVISDGRTFRLDRVNLGERGTTGDGTGGVARCWTEVAQIPLTTECDVWAQYHATTEKEDGPKV